MPPRLLDVNRPYNIWSENLTHTVTTVASTVAVSLLAGVFLPEGIIGTAASLLLVNPLGGYLGKSIGFSSLFSDTPAQAPILQIPDLHTALDDYQESIESLLIFMAGSFAFGGVTAGMLYSENKFLFQGAQLLKKTGGLFESLSTTRSNNILVKGAKRVFGESTQTFLSTMAHAVNPELGIVFDMVTTSHHQPAEANNLRHFEEVAANDFNGFEILERIAVGEENFPIRPGEAYSAGMGTPRGSYGKRNQLTPQSQIPIANNRVRPVNSSAPGTSLEEWYAMLAGENSWEGYLNSTLSKQCAKKIPDGFMLVGYVRNGQQVGTITIHPHDTTIRSVDGTQVAVTIKKDSHETWCVAGLGPSKFAESTDALFFGKLPIHPDFNPEVVAQVFENGLLAHQALSTSGRAPLSHEQVNEILSGDKLSQTAQKIYAHRPNTSPFKGVIYVHTSSKPGHYSIRVYDRITSDEMEKNTRVRYEQKIFFTANQHTTNLSRRTDLEPLSPKAPASRSTQPPPKAPEQDPPPRIDPPSTTKINSLVERVTDESSRAKFTGQLSRLTEKHTGRILIAEYNPHSNEITIVPQPTSVMTHRVSFVVNEDGTGTLLQINLEEDALNSELAKLLLKHHWLTKE